MHRNSKVSVRFCNGCIKAQFQFPTKLLMSKDMRCKKSSSGSVNNETSIATYNIFFKYATCSRVEMCFI